MTTSPSDANADLAVFEALAIKAGAVILAVRAKGVEAKLKNDQSPVTEADVKAEHIILEGLGWHFPGIPIVAEERKVKRSLQPLRLRCASKPIMRSLKNWRQQSPRKAR